MQFNNITDDRFLLWNELLKVIVKDVILWIYNLEDNLSGDLVVADYGDIEDDIVIFINQYKKGKIKGFYFSPKYIVYFVRLLYTVVEHKNYLGCIPFT